MKYFRLISCLLAVTFSSIVCNSQEKITFGKKISSCVDSWVTLPEGINSAYQFGFVYKDYTGGITFKLEGSFSLDEKGDYIRTPDEQVVTLTALKDLNSLVSLVPENNYKQLGIGAFPDWFIEDNLGTLPVTELFMQGRVHLSSRKYEKAIVYYKRAYQIDPNYANLRLQLAKSYNKSASPAEAVPYLNEAIEKESKSYLLYKELAHTMILLGKDKEAKKIAKKGIRLCSSKKEKFQIAYVLAKQYYKKKDRKNFSYWISKAKKIAIEGSVNAKNAKKLSQGAKSW